MARSKESIEQEWGSHKCPSDLQLSVDPWATGPKIAEWQRDHLVDKAALKRWLEAERKKREGGLGQPPAPEPAEEDDSQYRLMME